MTAKNARNGTNRHKSSPKGCLKWLLEGVLLFTAIYLMITICLLGGAAIINAP